MAPLYPWQYIYHQWRTLPDVDSFATPSCLVGKTVIVTGANTGLGLEAARHLAGLEPAKLILACRDVQKGRQAAWDIEDSTGCRSVESWQLDLANFESVRAFGKRYEREGGGQLHVLIENAAVSLPTYETTEDGWELMLKVNHIGTAHLALRLLPFLLAACTPEEGARLVVVTSEMHHWVYDRGAMESERVLEAMNDEERCRAWGRQDDGHEVRGYQDDEHPLHPRPHHPPYSPIPFNKPNSQRRQPGFLPLLPDAAHDLRLPAAHRAQAYRRPIYGGGKQDAGTCCCSPGAARDERGVPQCL